MLLFLRLHLNIMIHSNVSRQIVNIMNNTFSNIDDKHIYKCIMMAFCSNNHRNKFTSENWCVAKNRSTTFFFSQWNINSRELLLESQNINFDFCSQKVYVEHHVFKIQLVIWFRYTYRLSPLSKKPLVWKSYFSKPFICFD